MPRKTNAQIIQELRAEINDIKNLSRKPSFDENDIIQGAASRLYRIESDLQLWRAALRATEQFNNPTYANLLKIYREVDLDSEVTSAKEIRKNYVLSREFQLFDKKNNPQDKYLDFFQGKWFGDFLNSVLESIYWGYSLIKIDGIVDDKVTCVRSIQRQNVNPKTRMIVDTPYQIESGISIDDKKYVDWLIFCSDSEDDHYQGLYAKLSPYQIQLKVAQSSFTNYVNRFGSPNITLQTDTTNETQLRNKEKYLANFDQNSYAIIGSSDTLTLTESSGKSSDIFMQEIAEMKTNITKLILGSELADEKSFVGSAEIRQNITNIYSLKDINYCEYTINDQLIPKLVNLGLTFLDGLRFRFDVSNKANPESEFNQLIQLINTGKYNVPAKDIQDKFGIPVEDAVVAKPVFDEEKSTDTPDVQE